MCIRDRYNFKPQLRTLGRRFGKKINNGKEQLAALDGSAAFAELKKNGFITLTVDGKERCVSETAIKEP